MYVAQFARNADALSDAHRLGLRRLVRRQPTLRRIADRLSRELRGRRIRRSGYMNSKPHHAFYCRLPSALRGLPAISVLRKPLDWHISRYLHATRGGHAYPRRYALPYLEQALRSPEPARRDIARSFIEKQMGGDFTAKAWRSVGLEAYWRLLQDSRKTESVLEAEFDVRPAEDFPLGFLGCRTLMFTHREPQKLFSMRAQEAEEYFLSGRWREGLCDVLFLRQERLQEDLYAALLEMGYRKETLDAARELTPGEINAADPQKKSAPCRNWSKSPGCAKKSCAARESTRNASCRWPESSATNKTVRPAARNHRRCDGCALRAFQSA